ncbi:hypothetical protein [Herbiconiux solani]|uniref:hypothetical protein n=1 Tax=Herbiconiux solani TaxID=661329 RepID=UPI0008258105|nr:hypothetical protein [Herbiconiux solani]
MKSFASKEQMADRSRGAIPADTPFLELSLRAASRLIRNSCGWHIAPVIQTVFRYREDTGGQLLLPSLHIASIDSLTSRGTPVDLDENPVTFDPDTGWSNTAGCDVAITFTHGYSIPDTNSDEDDLDEIPEDIVDLTLMIASRALGAPLGYTREQSGQRSVSHSLTAQGVAGGTVLLAHEKDALAEYRIARLP